EIYCPWHVSPNRYAQAGSLQRPIPPFDLHSTVVEGAATAEVGEPSQRDVIHGALVVGKLVPPAPESGNCAGRHVVRDLERENESAPSIEHLDFRPVSESSRRGILRMDLQCVCLLLLPAHYRQVPV